MLCAELLKVVQVVRHIKCYPVVVFLPARVEECFGITPLKLESYQLCSLLQAQTLIGAAKVLVRGLKENESTEIVVHEGSYDGDSSTSVGGWNSNPWGKMKRM